MIRIPPRLLTLSSGGLSRRPSAEPVLEFGQDEQGPYAVYRLKKGEALYSAVVVRFTGRVHAEDVNAKAKEIAQRSGIDDVHAIPVGFAIKIPVSDLSPEYRAANDPERLKDEATRLEAAQFSNKVKSADLSGVTLVLDAGHGGRDTGALVDGIEEAAYVYDIACRLERLVKGHTRARVVPTVGRDAPCSGGIATAVSSSRSARVLTTPPYPIETRRPREPPLVSPTRSGAERADARRTAMVSALAHADWPTSPRTMVYVPGEKFPGTYGKSASRPSPGARSAS